MRKIVFIIVILIIGSSLWGIAIANIPREGKVLDKKTQLPIKDALILIEYQRKLSLKLPDEGRYDACIGLDVTRTDNNGNYTIDNKVSIEKIFKALLSPRKSIIYKVQVYKNKYKVTEIINKYGSPPDNIELSIATSNILDRIGKLRFMREFIGGLATTNECEKDRLRLNPREKIGSEIKQELNELLPQWESIFLNSQVGKQYCNKEYKKLIFDPLKLFKEIIKYSPSGEIKKILSSIPKPKYC